MATKRLVKKIVLVLLISTVAVGSYWAYEEYGNPFSTQPAESTIDNDSTTIIYVSNDVPTSLEEILQNISTDNSWKISEENPDVTISLDSSDENSTPVYQFFAVTKPWDQLSQEDSSVISDLAENIDEETFDLFDQSFFTYDNDSNSSYLLEPFSNLNGTRIAVDIDDKSIFEDSWWTNNNYPFTTEISISGNDRVNEVVENLSENEDFLESGYTFEYPIPDDFVEIIKTGTTVAGGPGWELCERVKGSVSYPIDEVKDVMENADISIISNESSFVEGCTQGAGTTSFCGKPTYIQNLFDMGIDVVSLTGNHMNDYGRDYFSQTIDLYSENNIKYFAAGKNSTEAWTSLVLEINSVTIGMIGYNKMGPNGVVATDDLTGTAYYDQEVFLQELGEIVGTVDIVWLDTQLWPEYGTTPSQEQITLTQLAIDNGVDIVTGVSSHEPQGMTFYQDKPVFYGLGNFLFDQMWSEETRLSIVPRIHIFNGKIINIEILPTRLYDYCQPRFLTGDDKKNILDYFVEISEY